MHIKNHAILLENVVTTATQEHVLSNLYATG